MGPSVEGLEKILQLIDAGMNVARLNFSHGTHEAHAQVIANLKKAREMRKVPLAIMLDTKGPEIRVGKIKSGQISLQAKQTLLLTKEKIEGDEAKIQITPAHALDAVSQGQKILFADGYIITTVKEITPKGVVVEVQNAGILKTQNGVNIPDVDIDLPAMTQQDIQDITFGCSQDVDLIAASFIRSAAHVLEIKELLLSQGKPEILVMAKIENRLGVKNFDSIIQAADGIMVARGDLGVELPIQEVPKLQKMMIRKCYQSSKPVVTATQMLESMIKNPRPTRAEVSDVANAIYDSTSAVMLSGETAIGAYPIETVEMMRNIIAEAERDFDYREFFFHESRTDYNDVSFSVSLAAVKTAYSSHAKAIFAFTNSGFTARLISRFRPMMPIVALTHSQKVYHQLSLNWGVIPADPVPAKNVQEAFSLASLFALKKGLAQYGDLVVITSGAPFGITGSTNSMLVESISN
jgi:pyruvate kinase